MNRHATQLNTDQSHVLAPAAAAATANTQPPIVIHLGPFECAEFVLAVRTWMFPVEMPRVLLVADRVLIALSVLETEC